MDIESIKAEVMAGTREPFFDGQIRMEPLPARIFAPDSLKVIQEPKSPSPRLTQLRPESSKEPKDRNRWVEMPDDPKPFLANVEFTVEAEQDNGLHGSLIGAHEDGPEARA